MQLTPLLAGLLLFISFPAFNQSYQKDTATVNSWNKQSEDFGSYDFDTAIKYADSAITLARKIKYDEGFGYALMYKALAYDYAGDFEKAFQHYDSAIVIQNSCNNLLGVGKAYGNKGVCKYYAGNKDEAVKLYLKAIKFYKSVDYNKGVSATLNNLGIVARSNYDYNKALEYYKESIHYKQLIGDTLGEIRTLKNIATLFFFRNDLEKANSYNDRCLDLAKKSNNEAIVFEATSDKGIYLNRMGSENNAEAKHYLLSTHEGLFKHKVYKSLCINYAALGYIYLEEDKLDSAALYLESAEQINDQLNVVETELEILRGQAQLYEQREDWANAFKKQKEYLALKKDLDMKSRSAEIKSLEAQYNYLEQQSKIENLNKEQAISDLKLEQSRFNQLILWIAIGVMLLVISYIIYLNKKRREQKDKLAELLGDREMLLKEIHHRVKNNLQMVSSLLFLQSESVEDNEALKALTVSRTRVDAMSIIHQKLYKEDDLRGISTTDYVDDLIDGIMETLEIEDDEIKVVKQIDELSLDIDTTIPIGLVMNELITNALKHAFPPEQKDRRIDIQLLKENDYLKLVVKDNGQGNHALNQKHSSGFGQKLIEMFVKKLRAEKTVTNENGYQVEIKIKNFKLM